MATLADVAARAGVSKATASRVLSGKTTIPISPETVARIRKAAEETGYTPNRVAAALATGRTHMIAVLLPLLDRPYYSALLGHIERVSRAEGYDLLISSVRPVTDLRRLMSIPSDGLILCELYAVGEQIAGSWAKRVPCAGIGSMAYPGMDSAVYAMDEAVEQAMTHMLEQGCRRIGYLTVPPALQPESARWRQYQQALVQHGLEPLPIIIPEEHRDIARKHVAEALVEHPDIDGLLCHTDHLALAALRAILDSGRKVPDDVVVVGCDNTEEGAYCEPPLSTVSLPIASACEEAWRLVLQRIHDPDRPIATRLLPAVFIPRASSLRRGAA